MKQIAELPPRTFCTFRRELSSLQRTISRRRTARNVLEELSGVSERPMIIPMTTTGRPQQRYDHRPRNLVQRTGDVTIATDRGVPRSTARGWLAGRDVTTFWRGDHVLDRPDLGWGQSIR